MGGSPTSCNSPSYHLQIAVKELEGATKQLLLASSYPAEQQGLAAANGAGGTIPGTSIVDQVNQLLASSRNVATSASTLISASMHVSAKPRDGYALLILHHFTTHFSL